MSVWRSRSTRTSVAAAASIMIPYQRRQSAALSLVNGRGRRQSDQAARGLLGDRTASGTISISRQVRLALNRVDRRLQRPGNNLQQTTSSAPQQLTLLFYQRRKVV